MQPAYLYLIDKPIAWLLASLPWFVIGIFDIGFFDSRLSLKQMAAILTALAISWLISQNQQTGKFSPAAYYLRLKGYLATARIAAQARFAAAERNGLPMKPTWILNFATIALYAVLYWLFLNVDWLAAWLQKFDQTLLQYYFMAAVLFNFNFTATTWLSLKRLDRKQCATTKTP